MKRTGNANSCARCLTMRIGDANMKMWPREVRAEAGGATVRGCEVLRIRSGVRGGARGFPQHEEFWVFGWVGDFVRQ